MKGYPVSAETREKIRSARMIDSWNRGKTKENDLRVASNALSIKKTFICGRKVWNKGLTKYTDERVARNALNVSKAKKGKPLSQKCIRATQCALHYRPNKQEVRLGNLLDELYPNKYKYSGDGSTIIGHYCPDFSSISEKKVVDLFGTYWHKLSEVYPRLKGFKKYGFSCLIIWDCELDNRDMVANKVREFTEGNPTIDQIYAWVKCPRIRKEIAKLEW